ncbi:DUF6481 family protein [Sphingopyxis panaciterrae]
MMRGYKEPSFQDRMAIAHSAKTKALAQLNSKAPIDPAEQARRIASRIAREEAQQVKRAAAQEAKSAAQAAKEAAQRARQDEDRLPSETSLAAPARAPSEAELKSARDLRYAARKARKGRS